MKTLLYTISDFKEGSIECIDMMLSHIEGEFDFAIVSNQETTFGYAYGHKVYTDDSCGNYIGFLKYSKEIPSGYDQYVYLDSDILFFGDLSVLWDERPLSVTQEFKRMNGACDQGRYWFKYPFDITKEYSDKITHFLGINAGSFAFKDVSLLSRVRELFEPYKSSNVMENAILEQSSFNYAVCQETNFDLNKALNFSDISVFDAHKYPYTNWQKLYHFCGFENSMIGKKLKMEKFINENAHRISGELR